MRGWQFHRVANDLAGAKHLAVALGGRRCRCLRMEWAIYMQDREERGCAVDSGVRWAKGCVCAKGRVCAKVCVRSREVSLGEPWRRVCIEKEK
eukprot:scaffold1389_cov184-Pinguiococcus_pyrenoidosus.AAC.1